MDDMKISFKVEITGCLVKKVRCPHAVQDFPHSFCSKSEWRGYVTFRENEGKLTKTCPMVRAQFEALE